MPDFRYFPRITLIPANKFARQIERAVLFSIRRSWRDGHRYWNLKRLRAAITHALQNRLMMYSTIAQLTPEARLCDTCLAAHASQQKHWEPPTS